VQTPLAEGQCLEEQVETHLAEGQSLEAQVQTPLAEGQCLEEQVQTPLAEGQSLEAQVQTPLAEGQCLEEQVNMLKLTNVPNRNTNTNCFEDSGATFSATKHRNDDACYAVSVSLIFPINYHNDIPHLEIIYCGKGLQIFFICAQVYWNQNCKGSKQHMHIRVQT
jgi:hypothetical protein